MKLFNFLELFILIVLLDHLPRDNAQVNFDFTPMIFDYEVVQTVTHDSSSFVEGLLFTSNGKIIESIGLTGQSKLVLYDINNHTHPIATSVNIPSEFGEGTTILPPNFDLFPVLKTLSKDKNLIGILVQLTYTAQNIHFHALLDDSIIQIGRGKVPKKIKEGWGLTTSVDGKNLIMGDGSPVLYYLSMKASGNIENFTGKDYNVELNIQKSLTITDCTTIFKQVKGLNELEIVPKYSVFPKHESQRRQLNIFSTLFGMGAAKIPDPEAEDILQSGSNHLRNGSVLETLSDQLLLTNIIGTWCVAIIDLAKTASSEQTIVGWINLKGLDPDFDRFNKVANGIAYRSSDNTLWFTGKRWKKMYQLKMKPASGESTFDASNDCKTPWSTPSSAYLSYSQCTDHRPRNP